MQQRCLKEISAGKRRQPGRLGHGKHIIIFVQYGKRPGCIGFDPGWALPDKFASRVEDGPAMRRPGVDEHMSGLNARRPLRWRGMGVTPAEIRQHRPGVSIKPNLFPVFTSIVGVRVVSCWMYAVSYT